LSAASTPSGAGLGAGHDTGHDTGHAPSPRRPLVRAESSAAIPASVAPWLLLAPFLLGALLFTILPLFNSVGLSTKQTFGPAFTVNVGAGNFAFLLGDPLFWVALRNTVIFTLGSVLIQLPLSLMLAMALNRPGLRGRAFFRVALFSPVLVGVVFVGMIFAVLLDKRTGLINQALHATIGFDLDFPWLESYIMPSLIIATTWQYVGFNMVYFLAALQNVSQELNEAALLDGAGPFSRFRHVVVPAILPVGTFVVLLSIVGSFQLFELPYILLNGTGGPENRGLTLVMYLYQTGFQTGDLGYASAIGWVMAIILAACAAAQRFISSKGEAR
jgi:ABC-type sugar transport system permease subunit